MHRRRWKASEDRERGQGKDGCGMADDTRKANVDAEPVQRFLQEAPVSRDAMGENAVTVRTS